MKAYDQDLRRRIVETVEEGVSTAETAARYKVSPASVKRYVKQLRETGTLMPKLRPGRRTRLGTEELKLLEEQVRHDNDLTLAEHGERLERATGLRVSVTTLHRAFKRLRITRKKDTTAERA
jgi:transposase